MVTRAEHIQWCKDRAMQYINTGDVAGALASFMSDMSKHAETENHSALQLMGMMMFSGQLKSASEADKFIQGFN